jgi:hypothetical protein
MAGVAGNENVTQVANLLLFQVNNLGYIYIGAINSNGRNNQPTHRPQKKRRQSAEAALT